MNAHTDIISVFVKWSAYVAAGQRLKRYDILRIGHRGPKYGSTRFCLDGSWRGGYLSFNEQKKGLSQAGQG